MARSIQCLKEPSIALNRMLRLSKRCVVTLPNLGYWKCRLNLASGKMPVTPELPSSWHETDNIHLCTIKDFEMLCEKLGLQIDQKNILPGSSQPQDLGTISYKDTETSESTQKIQSVETTASIVTETFQSEEKILPQDISPEKPVSYTHLTLPTKRIV